MNKMSKLLILSRNFDGDYSKMSMYNIFYNTSISTIKLLVDFYQGKALGHQKWQADRVSK